MIERKETSTENKTKNQTNEDLNKLKSNINDEKNFIDRSND